MKRDRYMCRKCGAPAEEVHHIKHLTPENIGDPSVTLNPDNLVCLCRDCHFEEHKGDKEAGKAAARQQDEYEFDENGMLVRKAGGPPGPRSG